MSDDRPEPTYDQGFWQQLWTKTLRAHGEKIGRRPPNAHLTAVAERLTPGRALDAGCGHGAEALWLAGHGWRVTAVDFSPAALDHAARTAAALGPAIAERVDWVQGDLTAWAPAARAYDLVACLYVHVPGDVGAMVRRLAAGVAPGGSLLLVGHQPIDPETGAATAAAGQTQVSVAAARAALADEDWQVEVAEQRRRRTGGGVDAVMLARRHRRAGYR